MKLNFTTEDLTKAINKLEKRIDAMSPGDVLVTGARQKHSNLIA